MTTQTNPQLKKYELAKGVTVEDYGCLLVSVYNAATTYNKENLSFPELLSELKKIGGFDKNGFLQWNMIEKLLGFTHRKITPNNFNTIKFSDAAKVFWIAEIPHYSNPKLSHFVNVLAAQNNLITYFDVYDGLKKQISLDKCRSIRKLHFF